MAFHGGSRGRSLGWRHQMPNRYPQNFHYRNQPIPQYHGQADFYPPPTRFESPEGWHSGWDNYHGSFHDMPLRPPPLENTYYSYYSEDAWNTPAQNRFPRPPAYNGPNDAGVSKSSSHPPTNQERYTLFETMLRCGEKIAGKTYLAIYWLEFMDLDAPLTSPLFENDPCGHAEDYLLEHLKRQLDVVHKERLKSVTIMQNASPCSRCAASYFQVLGDSLGSDLGAQIAIVFSAFHWLRRLSCRYARHPHKFISKEKHEENREGLRKLRRTGFTVRTTCYEDWRKLCTALQVPWPVVLVSEDAYQRSLRGQDDDRLREDLQEILS